MDEMLAQRTKRKNESERETRRKCHRSLSIFARENPPDNSTAQKQPRRFSSPSFAAADVIIDLHVLIGMDIQ